MPTATVSESDPVTPAPNEPLGARRLFARERARRFDAERYAERAERLLAA